jgi:hypothetical protein
MMQGGALVILTDGKVTNRYGYYISGVARYPFNVLYRNSSCRPGRTCSVLHIT